MSTKIKRIAAIMLAAILANSSILLASGEENITTPKVDNEEFLASAESNSSFNCPCMTIDYFEHETTERIIDIKSLEQNSIAPLSDENEIIAYDGKCGENASYHFDIETGTLTIWGKGAISDYSYSEMSPWYTYRKDIVNLEICDQINQIGNFAFYGLNNLSDIRTFKIDNNVKIFKGNANEITSNLKNIGIAAFGNCDSLNSISISSEKIFQQAFFNCSNLETVILREGVKDIEYGIFIYCSKIKDITIPASLKNMWKNAFNDMNGLECIYVEKSNANYSSDENGILYNKDKTELMFIPSASHWENNDTYLKYTDLSGNNYLIFNNCIYDFKVSELSNGIFNTEYRLTNSEGRSADVKSVRLIESKEYLDIYNIVVGRDIELYHNTFNKTKWYNPNGINVIYEAMSPTSSTYSRLYKYNKADTNIDLRCYNAIENYAFENLNSENDSVTLQMSTNSIKRINTYAFSKVRIQEIILDGKKLTYKDLMISDDDYKVLSGNDYACTFNDWNLLKNQFILAINNSFNDKENDNESKKNYLIDNIVNEFCNELIVENEWADLAKDDPYEAVFKINKWISSNITYGFLVGNGDNCAEEIIYTNGQSYFRHTLTNNAFGSIVFRHAVCIGYADLYKKIIENLDSNNITCEIITNGGIDVEGIKGNHAWNLIGINNVWYYTDTEMHPNCLYGQSGIYESYYVGYRNVDLEEGYITDMLKKYSINYSYISDDGVEYTLNSGGDNGELSDGNYKYNCYGKEVVINKVFSDESNIPNVTLELPENLDSISYRRYAADQAFYIYNKSENNFDNIIMNINLSDRESDTIIFDEISLAFKNKTIYGDMSVINDDFTIYYYAEIDSNNLNRVIVTISDQDQLKLRKKVNYKIKDYAKADNVSIMADNNGNFNNYQIQGITDNSTMLEYVYFYTYTDFSGYVNITGNKIDIEYQNKELSSEFMFKENGREYKGKYVVNFHVDDETGELYIDIETYRFGDINLDGKVDNDDVSILTKYLTKQYQFIQTGSDGNLTLNAPNITVNGDIATNNLFTVIGNNVNINGTVSAKEKNDSGVTGNLNIRYEISKESDMFPIDVISETFTDEAMIEWYFGEENTYIKTFEDNHGYIVSNTQYYEELTQNGILNNGFIVYHGNYHLKGNLKATNNIAVENSEIFNISSVIYSQYGDIDIKSNNVTINGFIYAPNGKVKINSSNLNITGTIIAKEIEIVSDSNVNFNVSAMLGQNGIIGGVILNDMQLMCADVNQDCIINIFDLIKLKRMIINL